MDGNTNGVALEGKKRKVTLRAFEIKNPNVSQSTSNAKNLITSKLNEVKMAKDRCMLLNQEDPAKLRDLISYFKDSAGNNSVFCTMLRISSENDVQHITDTLFEKDVFTMDDIESTHIDTSAICKDHYYFSLNDSYLVTNLPGNKTISRLQTYLNWFIDSDVLEFTPVICPQEQTHLSDLRQIIVQDPDSVMDVTSPSDTQPTSGSSVPMVSGTKSVKITEKILSLIIGSMSETKTLDEITLSQMISAELLIKFKKPRKMTEEDYRRALGAYLKPVSDLDNITFKRKDGKSEVKGRDLLRTKTIDIQTTPSGKVVEQQLLQEMSRFLRDLGNEKNGS